MPRNSGTGVWAPPPNINAVSGAAIESADWNALVQDISATFNAAWPIGLGGTGVSSLGGFLAVLGGVPLSGGVLTGPLTLSGDATAAMHPVTRQQMDAALALKAPTVHTHTSLQITDFSAAADARIALASINALSDVTIASPAVGDLLRFNGTAWVNDTCYTDYDLGAYANNATFTATHSLGVYPRDVKVWLECTTADVGYAVGTRWDPSHLVDLDTSTWRGGYLSFTTTTASYKTNSGFVLSIGGITASSWRVVIRVYR